MRYFNFAASAAIPAGVALSVLTLLAPAKAETFADWQAKCAEYYGACPGAGEACQQEPYLCDVDDRAADRVQKGKQDDDEDDDTDHD